MAPFFSDCMANYEWDFEDTAHYHPEWIPMAHNETTDETKESTPWDYQTAWKLKGTPYFGLFATYWGGGKIWEPLFEWPRPSRSQGLYTSRRPKMALCNSRKLGQAHHRPSLLISTKKYSFENTFFYQNAYLSLFLMYQVKC